MIKRKLLVLVCAAVMLLTSLPVTSLAATETNKSKQLMVRANQLVLAQSPDTTIRLTGVNLPGGEWTGTPAVERITRDAEEAITNWNCNLLRVPVTDTGWFGGYSYANDSTGSKYREYFDSVIDIASEHGVYVVLDFHRYESFNNETYLEFWRDAAVRYKNNPTVLFGILNEPHDISWDVWRDGNGSNITGHQQVVEMIRDLGAKNIIIAGGLGWGYNLNGVINGYALVDCGSNNNTAKTGYGIMYDSHIYPWKGLSDNWNNTVGLVRQQYPVLIGEVGWDADTNKSVGGKVYEPGSAYYHDQWCPAFFEWADDEKTYGSQAHYTAYSFHPRSAPRMLGDADNFKNDASYTYPPTEYWGVYVKQHLASIKNKHFGTMKTVTSLSVSGALTSYTEGYPFNREKGELLVKYSDGSTENVPLTRNDVKIEGFDSSTPVSSQTIKVTFKEKSATYKIAIKAFEIAGPSIPNGYAPDKVLDIDFEDAAYKSGTDNTVISTKNKATGRKIDINTYPTRSGNVYSIFSDSTKYIALGRKFNAAFDIRPEQKVYVEGKTVYTDFRIKRVDSSTDDPTSIYLTDDNGNRIFGINFKTGMYPTVEAAQSYGNETNDPKSTDVTLPLDNNWHYIRAIMNFDTKTFELYQGTSFGSLTKFVKGTDYFSFMSPEAANLGRITNYGVGNCKGALGFDDITVYTLKPASGTSNGGSTSGTKYVDIDFEGAYFKPDTNNTVIETNNKVTGKKIDINTYPNRATNTYSIKNESMTYIAAGRKYNVAFDIRPDENIYEAGKTVCVELKVKRMDADTDDPVSIYFTDGNDNKIFGINYKSGKIPTVIADSSYGTETNDPAATAVTYPLDGEWHYIRAMIDFDAKTFKLYHGTNPDNMTNFVKGVDSFGFISGSAENLGRITNYGMGDRKGALGLDDIKGYTVNPSGSNNGVNTPAPSSISNKYIDIDFEGAYFKPDTNNTVIETNNKATGKKIDINTYPNRATNTYSIKNESMTYIAAGRKYNVAFDIRPDENIYEAGKAVCVELKVKRVDADTDDPVSIYFTDGNDNKIFGINYKSGKIPTVTADSYYGTETNDPTATAVTYPLDGEWHYIRAMIDFDAKTFKLYQGTNPDNMTNFVKGVDSFGFISGSAENLGRITNYGMGDRKGALDFDDIKIYTSTK